MFFRSVCNPIFLGLGTAAIFAAGSAPVWADDPTTTPTPTPTPSTSSPAPGDGGDLGEKPTEPSPSPSPTPKPKLFVTVTLPSGKVYEGDTIMAHLHVYADRQTPGTKLKLTATGSPKPKLGRCADTACGIGTVGLDARPVSVKMEIPDEVSSNQVTLKAEFTATNATGDTESKSISITKSLDTPTPTPSPSNTGGTGGSGGGGGGGGGTGTTGGTGGTGNYPPTTPNGTFTPTVPRSPAVAFPSINPPSAPNPALAPGQAPAAPTSVLRSNERPAAQELTFERMASTQAAWLSALLVGFSLLLTQLRLGRRRPAPTTAATNAKGAHRRPRRGMFGS